MKKTVFLCLSFLLSMVTAVLANTTPHSLDQSTPPVVAEFVFETQFIQPGEPFSVGVKLSMGPEWHTYWMNPGEAGLPTQIEWDLPFGFEPGEIAWPFPKKFIVNDIVNYGYENEIVLLTQIVPAGLLAEDALVPMHAKVRWLACRDICIPGEADLEATLRVKNQKPELIDSTIAYFESIRQSLPEMSSQWQGVAQSDSKFIYIMLEPVEEGHALPLSIDFFPITQGLVDLSASVDSDVAPGSYQIRLKRQKDAETPQEIEAVFVAGTGWDWPGGSRALRLKIPMDDKQPRFAIMAKRLWKTYFSS